MVCAGLTYRFGEHVAVNDVDLEIRPGETFGLLGPNGAGKTTTIRMLTTPLKPAAGRVTVLGVDAAARPMLVLDEPTVGLGPIARTDMWEYIAELRNMKGEGEVGGMTVLSPARRSRPGCDRSCRASWW